ncbi:MAG: hypothetical protein HGA22_11940 [Clostridiales bacterium]|nr:hypothetical protein [Clostridiales bacterium]
MPVSEFTASAARSPVTSADTVEAFSEESLPAAAAAESPEKPESGDAVKDELEPPAYVPQRMLRQYRQM